MARLDPHSYADSTQPSIREVDWKAVVDFERSLLDCDVELHLDRDGEGRLDLDTRDLDIRRVHTQDGTPVPFTLHPDDPVIGSRLELTLPPKTASIKLHYHTSPKASALQWLTPEQTQGKQHPFLFSQCQAVHARSVIPLQDTPRVRIRYKAELTVPKALRGLMAARFFAREERGDEAIERYEMPQPIPPYLFAFAVGNLASKDLGPRSRVWSEPETLDKAAYEYAEVDPMIQKAEALFGEYPWERFDILNMPPSFPFGGMENPRLTFITPTLLVGDRSLVSVIAHELAHSWTGNLITNANAEHFWLNEGWTVYAELRIVEALYGVERATLQAAMGRQDLDAEIAKLKDRPELTKLQLSLKGIDADDAYNQVAYQKGYLFLKAIEEKVGRPTFDAFVRDYIAAFRFQSITTDDFLGFVAQRLPGVLEALGAQTWVHEPGIPANAPQVHSERLTAITALGASAPSDALAQGWSPAEWSLYLEGLPRPSPRALCDTLEARFHLSESQNDEVLVPWLTLACASGVDAVLPRIEKLLGEVGRMKYLRPLYAVLASRDPAKARALFERYEASYHPIAQGVLKTQLNRHGA